MKPNPLETHERRLMFENLFREGHTQTNIAGVLKVNKNTVTKDVRWLREKWNEEYKELLEASRLLVLKELESRVPQMRDSDLIALLKTVLP